MELTTAPRPHGGKVARMRGFEFKENPMVEFYQGVAERGLDSRQWIATRLRIVERALKCMPMEICNASGLNPASYTMWKATSRYPTPMTIAPYLAATGVTLDWFYYGRVSGMGAEMRKKIIDQIRREPPAVSGPALEVIRADIRFTLAQGADMKDLGL